MFVFNDYIPVDSANCHEHNENLKTELEVLGEKNLFAKVSKSAFWLESGIMLGSCRLQGSYRTRSQKD